MSKATQQINLENTLHKFQMINTLHKMTTIHPNK